jgi:hypothetical protein
MPEQAESSKPAEKYTPEVRRKNEPEVESKEMSAREWRQVNWYDKVPQQLDEALEAYARYYAEHSLAAAQQELAQLSAALNHEAYVSDKRAAERDKAEAELRAARERIAELEKNQAVQK